MSNVTSTACGPAPPVWVREFGLCTFELDGIVVSVDVFNAADELKLYK